MARQGGTATSRAASRHEPWTAGVAVAALALQPFALLLALASARGGIDASQLAAADPLVVAIGRSSVAVAAMGAPVIALAWWVAVRPSATALRHGTRQAIWALVAVGIGLPLLRVWLGPTLPSFIPPEESARPGFAAGLAAGMLEEEAFRLLLLPALLLGLRSIGSLGQRFLVASILVGLAFTFAHELGPGAATFHLRHFATRAIVPGFVMSLACRRPGFTFVVTGHCAAHLLLPLLFA